MTHRPSNRSSAGHEDPSTHPTTSFPFTLTAAAQPAPLSATNASSSSFPSALGLPSQPDSALGLLYSTVDLFRDFPTDDVCLEYIKEHIWPGGLAPCLKCGVPRKHYRVSGRKAYACNHCGHHIYPLACTIFSKSTTPLRTWFYILYLMLSTRGLLSARQIQRETGVTYKTAWRSRAQISALLPLNASPAADSAPAMDSVGMPNGALTNNRALNVVMKSGQPLEGPREETRKKMRAIRREDFTALAQKAIQTPSRKSSAATASAGASSTDQH